MISSDPEEVLKPKRPKKHRDDPSHSDPDEPRKPTRRPSGKKPEYVSSGDDKEHPLYSSDPEDSDPNDNNKRPRPNRKPKPGKKPKRPITRPKRPS